MEPSYQTTCPSRTDIISTIKGTWFYQNLFASTPQYRPDNANYSLQKLLKDYDMSCYKHVTFEYICSLPDWESISNKILHQEIDKIMKEGTGSYRGFATFVLPMLKKTFTKRVIIEIWAKNIITNAISNYSVKWLNKYYSPCGRGYTNAYNDFESIKINITK
tara:strand:- start:6700 stop:7185 length:486 start_codon:yes stop_codon:yes gene_type:complete